METLINILEVLAFIAKVAFSVSIVVLLGVCGVWASDEFKETRAERSRELARTSDVESFFTPLVEEARAYRARHRFDKTQTQYRHTPAPGAAPSYLEQVRAKTNKVLPFGDEDFFAALLKEQKELAPSW